MKLKTMAFAFMCFSYINFYGAETQEITATSSMYEISQEHSSVKQETVSKPTEEEDTKQQQEKFVQSVSAGNFTIFQLQFFGSTVKFITGWPVDTFCNIISSIVFGKNIYDTTKPLIDKVEVDESSFLNSYKDYIGNLKSVINVGISGILPIILYIKNTSCSNLIFWNTTISVIKNTKFFNNDDPYLSVATSTFIGMKLLLSYFYGFSGNLVLGAYNTVKHYIFARSLYFMYKANSQIFQQESNSSNKKQLNLLAKVEEKQITNALFLFNTFLYTYEYFSLIGLDISVISAVTLTLLYNYIVCPAYDNIVERFFMDISTTLNSSQKNDEQKSEKNTTSEQSIKKSEHKSLNNKDNNNYSLAYKLYEIFTNGMYFIAENLFSEIRDISKAISNSIGEKFSNFYEYFKKTIELEKILS